MLNLTDTWFIGRISTDAVAAVAAVQWLVIAILMLLSGFGLAVQTLVAQAYGAGQCARAARAVWTALWGALFSAPLFLAAGLLGAYAIPHAGLDPHVADLAAKFWLPRVSGAVLGSAVWCLLGFFNGIGRPRITLAVTAWMALSNAALNQLFIFDLGLGIAGSAWATTTAQFLALAFALTLFLTGSTRRRFKSALGWRLHPRALLAQVALGMPMGLLAAADLLGMALFQLMQVRLSPVAGAATQIAVMLTSVCYLPGLGIALAGTTLVGQSIGAGDRAWARRVGSRVIALASAYMGCVGLLLAAAGTWLVPLFLAAHDAESTQVIESGKTVLWFAAIYQIFDGLYLGSSFALRGAGDAKVPATLVLLLSLFVFVPLAHALIFAPGEGLFQGLPQLGLGLGGGWAAMVAYVLLLGTALLTRWRSRAWERIRLPNA